MTLRRGISYLFFRYFLPSSISVIILMSVGSLLLNAIKTKTSDCSTDWSLEDPNIAQDDPGLLTYIAKYHLEPPSSRPYNPVIVNLSEPSPQGPVIQAIFKGMRNGFFLEAGAFNGIQESNTLILERDFGWTGILVEGNSFILTELRLAYRKAWVADVCLALTPYPQKVKFTHHPGETSAAMIQYSALGQNPSNDNMKKFNEERQDLFISAGFVDCFPVFSVLAALNVTTVDYVSLDVEGAELKVLENIPFDSVNIKVFSVEHWIMDGGIPALDAFFATKNYKQISRKGSDVFYAQNALLSEYEFDQGILGVTE